MELLNISYQPLKSTRCLQKNSPCTKILPAGFFLRFVARELKQKVNAVLNTNKAFSYYFESQELMLIANLQNVHFSDFLTLLKVRNVSINYLFDLNASLEVPYFELLRNHLHTYNSTPADSL